MSEEANDINEPASRATYIYIDNWLHPEKARKLDRISKSSASRPKGWG